MRQPGAQDGTVIKQSERIAARQALPQLQQRLREELQAEGLDPDEAAAGAAGNRGCVWLA